MTSNEKEFFELSYSKHSKFYENDEIIDFSKGWYNKGTILEEIINKRNRISDPSLKIIS
jgi:hypothetical protein